MPSHACVPTTTIPVAFAPHRTLPLWVAETVVDPRRVAGDPVVYPITAGNDEDKVATSSSNGKDSVAGVIHSSCRGKVFNDLPARKRAAARSDRHRRSTPCERGC